MKGSGNFGVVYKGEWNYTAVALKGVKVSIYIIVDDPNNLKIEHGEENGRLEVARRDSITTEIKSSEYSSTFWRLQLSRGNLYGVGVRIRRQFRYIFGSK